MGYIYRIVLLVSGRNLVLSGDDPRGKYSRLPQLRTLSHPILSYKKNWNEDTHVSTPGKKGALLSINGIDPLKIYSVLLSINGIDPLKILCIA